MRPVVWCLAFGGWLIAQSIAAPIHAEEILIIPERESSGLVQVRDAANSELVDVARALRSLDQSYAFRGMVGCGSCTAGSAFVDWRSRGLCSPVGHVLPPPPLVLGGCRSRCGESVGIDTCSPCVQARRICTGCRAVYPRHAHHQCDCLDDVAPLPGDHVVIEPLETELVAPSDPLPPTLHAPEPEPTLAPPMP